MDADHRRRRVGGGEPRSERRLARRESIGATGGAVARAPRGDVHERATGGCDRRRDLERGLGGEGRRVRRDAFGPRGGAAEPASDSVGDGVRADGAERDAGSRRDRGAERLDVGGGRRLDRCAEPAFAERERAARRRQRRKRGELPLDDRALGVRRRVGREERAGDARGDVFGLLRIVDEHRHLDGAGIEAHARVQRREARLEEGTDRDRRRVPSVGAHAFGDGVGRCSGRGVTSADDRGDVRTAGDLDPLAERRRRRRRRLRRLMATAREHQRRERHEPERTPHPHPIISRGPRPIAARSSG